MGYVPTSLSIHASTGKGSLDIYAALIMIVADVRTPSGYYPRCPSLIFVALFLFGRQTELLHQLHPS